MRLTVAKASHACAPREEARSHARSALRVFFSVAVLALVNGCATPPLDLPLPKDARVVEVLNDYVPFHRSPKNRYALVLKGQDFAPPVGRPYMISTGEDVRRIGTPIRDSFVESDVDQLTRLLVTKGYDVYRADMGDVTPADLEKLIERIAIVSDDETKTFFAYSGEGDKQGLRTRAMAFAEGRRLITPDATISPDALIEKLSGVKGQKALLLNACESGVFADAARKSSEWKGVVIAACAQGYATTPHEPTGTSAIYAAFLDLYRDDPAKVRNLGTVKIEKAGGSWTNFRHRWTDFWTGSGLPISYEPVLFASSDFLF